MADARRKWEIQEGSLIFWRPERSHPGREDRSKELVDITAAVVRRTYLSQETKDGRTARGSALLQTAYNN